LDAAERSGRSHYLGTIETFFIGQNERGWTSDYYDDECWMCMALLRGYDLTRDAKYLSRAQSIFADVEAAWDVSCCGTTKGGVWWDRSHTQKATASNAGAALVAGRLYRRTGGASYLTFGRQVYNYWYAQMVNQTTGQVCDHITPAGEKVWWKFSYNEGLMIGAALELYEATGESTFLAQAHKFAGFMVSNEAASGAYGNVLNDGSNEGCTGDCAQFKGPAYRNLARLYARDTTRTAYANVLRASANSIWNLARDTNLNLFATSWLGPAETSVEMQEQNVAAGALSRFAQQNENYTIAHTNVFEAEEAIIHHIPLEATYGNYSGWGYLAGWNREDQSVDFKVKIATAGSYTLRFRYAAGAGNATRVVFVNGVVATGSVSFANTGAWSTYGVISLTQTFAQSGDYTITLGFQAARGSANYLNLDYLQILNYTAPAPGPLTVTLARPFVVLSWNSEGFLQSATSIAGPWTDVAGHPNSPATLTMPMSESRYYRLRD
jgi:predicted alpha-1,6-mannanase (GH76 family)